MFAVCLAQPQDGEKAKLPELAPDALTFLAQTVAAPGTAGETPQHLLTTSNHLKSLAQEPQGSNNV